MMRGPLNRAEIGTTQRAISLSGADLESKEPDWKIMDLDLHCMEDIRHYTVCHYGNWQGQIVLFIELNAPNCIVQLFHECLAT